MAFEKRHLIIAGRLAAAALMLAGRGRVRKSAWAAHDILWLSPTLSRNCSWHGEVITRFETSEKEVWLTIDDGPDPRDTPDILNLLDRHNAKASFFGIGRKVEANRGLCRQIVARGHSLENHTYSHPACWWWISPGFRTRREISLASEAIAVATGRSPRFFRSPVGMTNLSVHPAAQQANLKIIGWSASGKDGCPAAPSQIVERIMTNVAPGAIILLHESGPYRRRAVTMARLLEKLSGEGYRCILPPEASLR